MADVMAVLSSPRVREMIVNLAEDKSEEEIKRPGSQGTTGFRVNTQITAPKVRLVMDDGSHQICTVREALQAAKKQGLDLVEVGAASNPPVCRLMDHAAFLSSKRKKEREEAKKVAARQREDTVKEMRFSARTAENDLEMKMNTIEKFLAKGRKVKVSIDLKGELVAKRGHAILQQVMAKVEPIARLEGVTREGQTMFAWVVPNKDAPKAAKQSTPVTLKAAKAMD
eukprot:jgi/Mesvir1/23540/Mv18241-RA.1